MRLVQSKIYKVRETEKTKVNTYEQKKEGRNNMSYSKWKPSKARKQEFKRKMQEIEEFCDENKIKQSMSCDSYYFKVNGQQYRVSNHAIESRIGKIIGYDDFMQPIREKLNDYQTTRDKDVIYIHASKTRIIEIYNDLKAGYKLDGRGNRK